MNFDLSRVAPMTKVTYLIFLMVDDAAVPFGLALWMQPTFMICCFENNMIFFSPVLFVCSLIICILLLFFLFIFFFGGGVLNFFLVIWSSFAKAKAKLNSSSKFMCFKTFNIHNDGHFVKIWFIYINIDVPYISMSYPNTEPVWPK